MTAEELQLENERLTTELKRLTNRVADLEDTPGGTYVPSGIKASVDYPSVTVGVGGSDTQVQFNDAGSFNGNSRFTFDKADGGDVLIAGGESAASAGGDFTLRAGDAIHTQSKGNLLFQAGRNSDANGGKTGRYSFRMLEGDTYGDNQLVYDVDGAGSIYKIIMVGTGTTSNATPTTLNSGFITLNANESVLIEAHVTARRTGGSSGADGDSAGYVLRGLYQKVGAGSATLIGSVGQTVVAESQAGWDATLTASGNIVNIQITGAANNDILWMAEIEYWFCTKTT